MNENLNLVEILKDCPKGTKLYSPIAGEVFFKGIDTGNDYPIDVSTNGTPESMLSFTCGGLYYEELEGECLLFPSKDQRDWSKFNPKKPKFDPKTLQPFDSRVLIRDKSNGKWSCSLFSHIDNELYYPFVCINGSSWRCCIPYNDDTKHLVGTTEEAPEFYRYWED